MRVGVVDPHPTGRAEELHASIGAGVGRQARGEQVDVLAEQQPRAQGQQRVLRVVGARAPRDVPGPGRHRGARRRTSRTTLRRRGRGRAGRHRRRIRPAAPRARVAAQARPAPGLRGRRREDHESADRRDELVECGGVCLDGAVVVEVVGVDVGDDRALGRVDAGRRRRSRRPRRRAGRCGPGARWRRGSRPRHRSRRTARRRRRSARRSASRSSWSCRGCRRPRSSGGLP